MGSVMFSRKSIIFAFILLPFIAYAENGTAWDLDNMQKQRVLYEAKAALNKAKAEAEGRESGVPTVTGQITNPSGQVNSVSSADALPQLVKINGKKAVISLSDGNTTTVSTGQMLPGGRWQVLSIGLGGVKVKNISTQRVQVIN
ncbi:type IV pilus biogenesis protein PilP [Salmonella enterica]|nr:type IV pilus biogenesis protein PilP [Salmonella enterica]EDD5429947.1 type IV pilus biogenesis protein PilP [Salmonella enterica subsp. enterica serovar Enteritidis]EAY1659382.1 type IV pilus biogenesis protein PilP [Salmonella enterica]EBH5069564.1 type IV pilus biogenesis protein PilP [Salmonella enterica]ECC1433174.1 type IV pilus biogenesis protein PilP [Salmonella enterica]